MRTRAEHAPVRLAPCSPGASQWIRVREIDTASHDVILTVPRTTLCLGIGAAPGGPSGVVPGAPLVVGTRETSDAEFLRMVATDGSSARPTSGFMAGAALQTLPVGRFDGNARAGVTSFSGLDFWIARGADPAVQISRQHMR